MQIPRNQANSVTLSQQESSTAPNALVFAVWRATRPSRPSMQAEILMITDAIIHDPLATKYADTQLNATPKRVIAFGDKPSLMQILAIGFKAAL